MAQMRAAVLALHFDAQHAVRAVGFLGDHFAVDRLEVARPAAAGVELGVRFEQRRAAADAVIDAAVPVVVIAAGEGALGGRVARHLVFDVGELFAPLGVVFLHGGGAGVEVVGLVHGRGSCLKIVLGARYEEQLTSSELAQSGGSPAYASFSGCSSNGRRSTAARRSTSEKSFSFARRIAVSAR